MFTRQDKKSYSNDFVELRQQALAGDRMAQYRMAKAYPKQSEIYVDWMQKAAAQGLTNAQFALAEYFSDKDKQQACHFLIKLLESDDSFIKRQTLVWLGTKPELAKQMKTAILKSQAVTALGFFSKGAEAKENGKGPYFSF